MRVSYGSQEVQVSAGEFVSNLLRAISIAPDVAALQWPMRKACRAGLDKRVAELTISAVAVKGTADRVYFRCRRALSGTIHQA